MILFGVIWFLLAPFIFSIFEPSIPNTDESISYVLLFSILIIGGIIIGSAYYKKLLKLSVFFRTLISASIAIMYITIGYYYFVLISIFKALA